MSKKLDAMVIDMKAYGLLMESCCREAERIVGLEWNGHRLVGPAVGIKQVDALIGRIDILVTNLSHGQAVTRIARLLFQAAIRHEEDHVADTV